MNTGTECSFARFLAENHLLMHPDGVAVSLEECEELAKELSVTSSQLSEKTPTTDNRQLRTDNRQLRTEN